MRTAEEAQQTANEMHEQSRDYFNKGCYIASNSFLLTEIQSLKYIIYVQSQELKRLKEHNCGTT